MKKARIYCPETITIGEMVRLTHEAAHHVLHVLRLPPTSSLIIFNGQGGEFLARIEKIEKQIVWVLIEAFQSVSRESSLKIHLGQAVISHDKMDWIVQKAVELGVDTITPIITERCNFKLPKNQWPKRLDHWRKIIINACEQCGRNTIPSLNAMTLLSDWFDNLDAASLKLTFHPKAETRFSDLSLRPESSTVLIGPEGGLTDTEIALTTTKNFQIVQLGARILRAETAAISALVGMQMRCGDF